MKSLIRSKLGFNDKPDFVQRYLSRLNIRYYLYEFEWELVHNANVIRSWATISARVTTLRHFDLQKYRIQSQVASHLLDIDTPRPLLSMGLDAGLAEYLRVAGRLNESVGDAFDQIEADNASSRRTDGIVRKSLRELAESEDAKLLLRAADRLSQAIDQTLSAPFY